MQRLKYILLVAVLWTRGGASAAEIGFRALTVDEGLSQSTVLALAQDPLGRVWMGTQDGLNRYDGYAFTVFRHDDDDPASLGDNYVNALWADGGRMWIGTSLGLSCFDAATGRFENYTLEGRAMPVADIAAAEDGSLILATALGVVSFDRATHRLEIRSFLKDVGVHSICPCRDGFLLGTSGGVYTYSPTYGNAVRILPQLARYDVASIVGDSDGFWVATHGNGLFRLDASLQVCGHYSAADYSGLASDYIRVLKTDTEGQLWIGTFDGLSIRDPRSGRFRRWVHTVEPGSLSHNSIRSIFIDSQQGVWLGTYYGGVNYYHPQAQRFEVVRHVPSRNSLGDNTVSCIVEEPAGSLWIGTNDDGVNLWDRSSGRFTDYSADNGVLLSNNIKCILPDGRGNLWIGTHAGGLSRMEIATRRTRHYSVNASIPINNSCYALLDNGDGTLWAGTLNGLLSFDTGRGRFSRHFCSDCEPRLGELPINALMRDSRRNVWIGTASGLFLYVPAAHEVQTLELSMEKGENSPPLQDRAVLCLAEDSRRNIWVGTRQGLWRYDDSGRCVRFTTDDGLPNDIVYGVLEDELGRLWISTNGGLACFDATAAAFRTYTWRDGLANSQFNPGACYKGRDGLFYFGGIGGLTCFRPHELVDNPFTPAAQIVGVDVADAGDDRRVRIECDSLGRVVAAAFPSVRNIFSVRFVAVNPLSGGRNTFSYKLEGFNTRWYETQNLEASYSNLKPGDYTFRVRAANSDGRWSDDVSEVGIRVLPMWWQTLAARILWGLLTLSALVGLAMAVQSRMKMKVKLHLERMEKQQIGELSQEKIRFYVNLSHELRTPLTLIVSPLQEIREHGTVDKYVASRLNYVYRNSLKLLHLVNQLLDYRKAELGVFRMKVAVQDVDGIVAEVFSMFEEVAQNRDMDYILNSELRGEQLPVDRMFLEMMLTNLLSNAFKFTPDGGTVRVSLLRGEGCFRLSVRDSGAGMSDEQQRRAFDRFGATDGGGGLGLSIVRRIVELHQGSVALRSEEGVFSEFIITLPDDIAVYPEEKRARADDVRGSIIRDAEQFLPDEWSGEKGAGLVSSGTATDEVRDTLLLAEANGEVSGYIAEHFKRHYDVHVVADGNEALERLKSLEPDLIIADRMLPGIDGLKLCRMIKQNIRTCHIPVVLLAPDGGVEEQIAGTEAGADAYLPMPLSVSLLRAKVQNLLKVRYRMRHRYSDDAEIDPDKITSNSMDGEFLKKAIRIVEENMDNEEFSSNDFSKALCMSRSNLHLKMKSITGESATKFIRKIRFNHACKLLLEHRYSISEISSMVGFSSPSYFATSFKKHVGCLPTEYVRSRSKPDSENS